MKRLLIGSAFSLALVVAAQAQKNETLEGNGNLVTKDISVEPFTTLEASGVYELKLVQGSREFLKIEADENLQALFTVRSSGGKLSVEMDKLRNKNLKSKNKLRVYVYFKTLKSLELQMVGNVNGTDLKFDDLKIENESVGNVDLDMTANRLELKNASVGNLILSGKAQAATIKNESVGGLRAGDFVVQTLDIDNEGIGGAEVHAVKGLKVKDSFLGKVKNRGGAPARKTNKVVI